MSNVKVPPKKSARRVSVGDRARAPSPLRSLSGAPTRHGLHTRRSRSLRSARHHRPVAHEPPRRSRREPRRSSHEGGARGGNALASRPRFSSRGSESDEGGARGGNALASWSRVSSSDESNRESHQRKPQRQTPATRPLPRPPRARRFAPELSEPGLPPVRKDRGSPKAHPVNCWNGCKIIAAAFGLATGRPFHYRPLLGLGRRTRSRQKSQVFALSVGSSVRKGRFSRGRRGFSLRRPSRNPALHRRFPPHERGTSEGWEKTRLP
jgi:hypothetical protein